MKRINLAVTVVMLTAMAGMGQADGLKKYRALRKDRARMMTIQRERALAASK